MKLVTADEMRALDRAAAEDFGIPGAFLMENASKALADAAMALLAERGGTKVTVLCGKGNNGGDGFGAARWLQCYGMRVRVLLIGCLPEQVVGDAGAELRMFIRGGGELHSILTNEDMQYAEIVCLKADLLLDAVLGTGFSGELRDRERQICALINNSGRPVLAADVPTGVDATTGQVADGAVQATATVTLGLLKTGLLLYPAREYCGRLFLAQIGFSEALLNACGSKKRLVTQELARSLLPVRSGNAHKGDAGRVVVAAGSTGYTGAAALAATGAVKAGAGLVSLVTPLSCRDTLAVKLTEVMVHGLVERMPGVLGSGASADLLQWADKADVLALGPGLGTTDNTQAVVRELLQKTRTPVVIDADALTALQGHTELLAQMQAAKILTPHVGEMARLLNISAAEVERRRLELAESAAGAWQAVVVLKGAPTVIAAPDGSVYVNTGGCSAMATGGSGDVLTGIIAALAAQGRTPLQAAVCGVYLHGLAGVLATDAVPGLAAGEIAAALPEARKLTLAGTGAEEFIYNRAVKMIK